jgi:hypothetical protein
MLAFGFVLGLRHALDADHIAAVSALASQQPSLFRSCLLGTFWGFGHTTALLAAAVALIAFKLTISPGMERTLETGVALLLVLLGGRVLLGSIASWAGGERAVHLGREHPHAHSHGDAGHEHAGHTHVIRLAGRPFLVGLLHGAAGSAALMLMVLATIPSPVGGLLYVLIFGAGSTVGMLLMSGLIGVPFALTLRRSREWLIGVQALAGSASLLLGCWLIWHPGAI